MTNADQYATFDYQYYPTPRSLARRMFAKFNSRQFNRILDPQAGRGDLVDFVAEQFTFRDRPPIECVEIDPSNQAILRAKSYRVVGADFLKFQGHYIYSHIITNPPFRVAVKHMLHAWNLLLMGEISGVVPARMVKYARTAEEKLLVALITQHGSAEYLTEAFTTEDTKRMTRVDVCLVYLRKTATDYMSFIEGLRKEVEQHQEPTPDSMNELIVPRDSISNLVINFDCAVEAARQACLAKARARHFAARLDDSLVSGQHRDLQVVADKIGDSFAESYEALKERAWSTVLQSSAVLDRLSSQAQKRVRASFKEICRLEFTYDNIWGFLDGIIAQQGQLQIDMMCEVFDIISEYHTQNCAYYQGWKSNDKHRLNAFRIKSSRIIVPAHVRDGSYSTYSGALRSDDQQRLRDFDKVFALLDGKSPAAPIAGLVHLFTEHFNSLRSGKRLSSDYFDVRFYPKTGTFHLYPRRKDLIDKINRMVGAHRQWLPHDRHAAPAAFWAQYEAAETITARVPDLERLVSDIVRSTNSDAADEARAKLLMAWESEAAELGIHYSPSMLDCHQPELPSESSLPLLLRSPQ